MEKTRNMKRLLACFAVSAVMACSLGLAACGSSTSSSAAASSASASSASASSAAASSESSSAGASSEASSASASAAAAPGEAAGFEETPIFEDIEAGGWLNVSAVYFQPVPMTDGSTIEGKDIHLEADISALANNFGFGVGDWVPYLTVDYKVLKADGSEEASGTFMEMSASDGPHYGANIAMPDGQGTYTLEITIKSPADNNYLLHTDAETGPGAKSFDDGVTWPLVVSESWDYVPLEY